MKALEYAVKAADEVMRIVSVVDPAGLDDAAVSILGAKSVFVAGAGRSLLMLKAFAMRLMHFGLTVHVVGETTTPAITEQDILVTASGSGETETVLGFAKRAVLAGAALVVLTTDANSALAAVPGHAAPGHIIVIPAGNKLGGNYRSWQPAGNSFEQSLLLVLDGIAMRVADERNPDFTGKLLLHANLE